jgi:hypothetical protein
MGARQIRPGTRVLPDRICSGSKVTTAGHGRNRRVQSDVLADRYTDSGGQTIAITGFCGPLPFGSDRGVTHVGHRRRTDQETAPESVIGNERGHSLAMADLGR